MSFIIQVTPAKTTAKGKRVLATYLYDYRPMTVMGGSKVWSAVLVKRPKNARVFDRSVTAVSFAQLLRAMGYTPLIVAVGD